MSKRIIEFDILKGIGMLLVVLGHTGVSGLIYKCIYAFHMPLFFFASGCFHKQREPFPFLKRKAKGLMLPYLFFVSCFLIISITLDSINLSSLSKGIQTTLTSINPFDEHCWVLYHTIWFLICLFEVSMIYYIIEGLSNSKRLTMIGVIMLALLGYILRCKCDYQCFFLDSACTCTLYYALGHYFRNAKIDEFQPRMLYLIFCSIAILVVIAVLRPDVEIVRNRYPFYLPIIAVASIVTLFYFIKYIQISSIQLSRCLSWLGDNSLAILGIHSIFYYLFDFFFADKFGGLLFIMLKFITTLPFIYISIILVKILIPNIFGKYETKIV